MVNQAVEIHDQQASFGTLQSSAPKIASDTHNLSLIKLDVEKVGRAGSVDRIQVQQYFGYNETTESNVDIGQAKVECYVSCRLRRYTAQQRTCRFEC